MDVFFWNSSEGGGGVISDPKNYIADFVGFKAVYFGRKFWKKCLKRGKGGGGVISNPKKFIANLRKLTYTCEKSAMKFPKRDKGGSRSFGLFQKNIHIWGDGHLLLRGHFPKK